MAVPDVQEMLRLLEEGRNLEAVDLLEVAADRERYSATVRVLLAHAYEREERLGDALRVWWSALFLMPTSPVARDAVARLLAAHPELEATTRRDVVATTVEIEDESDREDGIETGAELDFGKEPEVNSANDAGGAVEADPAIGAEPGIEGASPASSGNLEAEVAPHEELDRLITELESARIVPDPDFELEEIIEEDDEGDELVSETLARIYAAQRQFDEAAQVYDTLAVQHPERAREYRARADELRGRG